MGESITDAASRKVHPSHHCWLTSTCAGLCWDGRCSGSSKASARIVTYADDLVILCRRGKAEEALQQLRMIMGKLKLTVNEEKTRICKVPEGCVHSRRPHWLTVQAILAASLWNLGSEDEVRLTVKKMLADHPNLTANRWAQWLPYRNQTDLDAAITPLRIAGLHE